MKLGIAKINKIMMKYKIYWNNLGEIYLKKYKIKQEIVMI